MEKTLYDQYKKYFIDVDGVSYWQTLDLVVAGIAFLIFYGFDIWIFYRNIRVGIGVTVLLILLTSLAIYGLIVQIKLRKKAKEICENAEVLKTEILNGKIFISNSTICAEVNLLFPDGKTKVKIINCSMFGMKKYKAFGVFIIQSKYSKKEIILKAKEYDSGVF